MAPSEILLITRVRTVNKGNQALSVAWTDLLRRAFPGTPVRVLERRPRHLVQYTLRQLAHERDPVAAFAALVSRLARMSPGPGSAGPVVPVRIDLDETLAKPQRFAAVRQALNLRGRAASLGAYAAPFRIRLAAMERAGLVVINPAGEFFPREPLPAYYHLLDAAVAAELGRPTAIVNHTMDITDPTLRAIIPGLYKRLAIVGFRDTKSLAAFRAFGGDLANVVVAPDLAIASVRRTTTGAAPLRDVVAVTVNVPEATAHGYLAQWHDVIAGLRDRGVEVELLSNEVPLDRPFYEELRRRHGVRIVGDGLDHERYSALLGEYSVSVTSRMHTAILAMLAGTPVVPVEGSSFKITGMFQELGLDSPVVQPGTPGWVANVVERVLDVRAHRAARSQAVLNAADTAGARIDAVWLPRLRAAASVEEGA
jgi:polysaccharide pyruvyl transferase WcaK-like protein